LQEDDGKTETLSSMPQASFNYINSIVGSGVIGIPYALHRAGFGLGLLLLILVAIITDYSLILMVSEHTGEQFSSSTYFQNRHIFTQHENMVC
jgi:amino acid permease